MPATPLSAFGYGLSYSSYQYSNHIEPPQVRTEGTARISINVKSTGDRAGVETVQLYLHRMTGPVLTPVKQLRGFERVELQLTTHFRSQVQKYARNRPLISFVFTSVLRSRTGPS